MEESSEGGEKKGDSEEIYHRKVDLQEQSLLRVKLKKRMKKYLIRN